MQQLPVLPFAHLPAHIAPRGKIYLAMFDFSGIQRFIFGGLTVHSSRAQIAARSGYIRDLTKNILELLQAKFAGKWGYLFHSISSGKLYCAFSHRVNAKKLERFCCNIQRRIYASTAGQLTMFYALTPAECIPEADFVPGKMLHAAGELTRKLGFAKFHCTALLGLDMQAFFDPALAPVIPAADSTQQVNTSKMAVKLDLDNLGAFFGAIISFDTRSNASRALERSIDDTFYQDRRLEVIYTGGDDIFVLFDFDDHLQTLADIYENLKARICSSPDLAAYAGSFSISGGVFRIRGELGTTPLIYYFNPSEERLEAAKRIKTKNSVTIDGYTLTWHQLCTLCTIAKNHADLLFSGLEPTEIHNITKNIGELRGRILRCRPLHLKLDREVLELVDAITPDHQL